MLECPYGGSTCSVRKRDLVAIFSNKKKEKKKIKALRCKLCVSSFVCVCARTRKRLLHGVNAACSAKASIASSAADVRPACVCRRCFKRLQANDKTDDIIATARRAQSTRAQCNSERRITGRQTYGYTLRACILCPSGCG